MVDQDDLEFNPFYQALQSRFSVEFEHAQEQCYLVCIPQIASLAGVHINQTFVDTHLLKPSPLLKDNYQSTDKAGSKTVILDGHSITTMEGFQKQREVRIIAEELCYNKKYKPYKMLIVQSPLEGDVKGRRGSGGLSDDFLTPRTTFVENVKFLNMFPENRFQLLNLDKSIQQFNKNYLMVSGYLEEAAKKLRKIWQDNRDALIEANNTVKLQSDIRLEEVISIATESYLMGGVYNKVFKAVSQQCAAEDRLLVTKMEELRGVRGENLGLKTSFCCPMPNAVVELARLDGIYCPHEKLLCLKETLSSMTNDVADHIKENLAPGEAPDCLTSDDLIPLIVLVITQAKCQHLASNILYVELFHWITSKSDDLGYSLVTFKAAKEYMKSTDFSQFSQSRHKLKKEMTIEEIMEASGYSNDDSMSILSSTPTNAGFMFGSIPLQREMDNISKMMEENMGLNHQQHQQQSRDGFNENDLPSQQKLPDIGLSTRSQPKPKKAPKMGDFLLALKNDVLDSTYGKQE